MSRNKKIKGISYLGASALLEEKKLPFFHRLVIFLSAVTLFVFIDWASTTKVSEVAMTKGQLVPSKGVVSIQHQFGGEIDQLMVTQGQKVKVGDTLLTLKGSRIVTEYKRSKLRLKSTIASKKFFDEEFLKRKELTRKGLESKLYFLSLKAKKNELEGEIAEQKEVVEGYQKQLASLQIKSPIEGYVHGLSIIKVGIIKAGSTIMEIIPNNKPLVAEVEISPTDIGHVRPGQLVKIKVDSYDFNKYGAAEGRLKKVSPTTYFGANGKPHYKGYVEFIEGRSLPFDPLLPGMTVIADIHTGNKSVLEYLLKPVLVSADQALRER